MTSRPYGFVRTVAALVITGAVFTTCRETQEPRSPAEPGRVLSASLSAPPPPGSVVLVGAGDIALCNGTGDEATAALLDSIPGTVFTLGDNAYANATPTNYQNCYNPSWGRHKARTYPVPGNREYDSSATAAGYFGYFGAAAGDPTKGYYSYDLGAWHIVVLNSNTTYVSTALGSPQETWLKADLAATTKKCILAMWHSPRFYSTTASSFSPTGYVKPFWDDLAAAHAQLIINGHMNDYERFAPQTSAGVADAVNGIRQFIAGTGGNNLDAANTLIIPNSEVRISKVYGVLKLTLGDGTYAWQFIPVAGQTASDSGSGTCYAPPPQAPAVNAGPDLATHPGDTFAVRFSFSDAGPNDGPWTYTITWGDGGTSSGTAATAGTQLTATHSYGALGRDSVRVTVTNSVAMSGSDSLSVQVISSSTIVLVGAGDIADCTKNGDSLTANLMDTIPGTVFAAGDQAYPEGSPSNFTTCYDATWGRHKARTRPVLGNHDYATAGAAGYFGYFGSGFGDATTGYYSYDLAAWHIVVLNSNYTYVPTAVGSAQEAWLKTDLAATNQKCILAIWHHPRFYSSTVGPLSPSGSVRSFWDDLYAVHADLVINGHMHDYERFAPQDPAGALDSARGIREIIAGTGGGGLDAPNTVFWPTSEVRISLVYGVLKLTLANGSYSWKFLPVAGKTATDSGSTACHNATNHAPTAVPGGPYSGVEGGGVTFDGSASSDPDGDAITYAWSFGDGTSGTGVRPTHAYADNGSYTVTLTVTDSRGAGGTPATTAASIANVPPTVTTGANQTATAGTAYTFSASFSDAGVSDTPWVYVVDWGDSTPQTSGSTSSQASPITAGHTYAALGTDTVRVSVTDKDGGVGSAKAVLTVAGPNHPPTAAAGGPYTGTEGSAVAFDGSGSSDPDGDAITYAWSFGDGATGIGAKPSHAYVDNGVYAVSLTVTDARNTPSTAATTTATIGNAAPVVNAGASQTATVGNPVTLNATFSDPGANDAPWAYTIDWGDGSPATVGSATSPASPIAATHTYVAAGSDTVRVTVTDKDGGIGVGKVAVTVNVTVTGVTLVGAGNIGSCSAPTASQGTAAILDTIAGTVFTAGDNAYPNGTPTNYLNCYDPSWGRHKARTYPAPGNHEYDSTATAAGYFGYFGAAAGDPTKGYYSYDLGAWHIVVLNSTNTYVSTAAGSPQETWLKADLAASTKRCQLAIWHSPRFYSTTSTSFSPTGYVKPFWDDLYAAGAELIINAHMQDYERFAPQTSAGVADPANGIREIIVGTGGSGLDSPNTLIIPNSEVRISKVYGALRLTLGDGTYAWQFIPVAGQTATDAGTGTCH